ncbi:MarR family transcriptional regulator [Marivirga salinae]|uniref:MarR family transcriptional regulator n=1 Tax=Marivirga salinarum TaxID=3059078 RepID=A0AA51NA69_9BACT|nr:MarR family transcriptional regulator [Marivirga sp. BDSF4-3]WMN11180.1 MarR family transcriptional regulator [Marivirga sp. BDSF4-3]
MADKFSALYLEKQLCFPLYAASRLTTKLYAPYLNDLDITYPQYLVMLVLWEHEEQTVNKIGERLLLESNTLTPLLKRLEKKGFIYRKRSETDERTVVVSLSKEGDKLKLKAAEIPEKIIGSFRDETISETEIYAFKEMLEKLIKGLESKLK